MTSAAYYLQESESSIETMTRRQAAGTTAPTGESALTGRCSRGATAGASPARWAETDFLLGLYSLQRADVCPSLGSQNVVLYLLVSSESMTLCVFALNICTLSCGANGYMSARPQSIEFSLLAAFMLSQTQNSLF